jgi:Mg2+/Co2+ transporter CorB
VGARIVNPANLPQGLAAFDLTIIGVASAALLFVAGACAAFAAALQEAPRARLQQLETDGSTRAAEINRLWSSFEALQGAMLLIKGFAQAGFCAVLILPFWEVFGAGGAIFAALLSAAMLFIFADIVPRAMARQYAETLNLWFGGLVRAFRFALFPLTFLAERGVRPALRFIGLSGRDTKDQELAHAEIRDAIDLRHAQGAVDVADRNMLGGILDLKELQVADVMVHRQNMVMLDLDQPAEALLEKVLSQPHTRLPLFRRNPDNIVGVLHAKDLLRAMSRARGNIQGINILAIAARPWYVPDTTLLADQLRAFLQRRTHFALVVDEYGALQGLITLEDILEEIVGEIRDEHDLPMPGVRPQADGTVYVDGWVTLRELNRSRNWALPDEAATTIAGLVIHESQSIPEAGQIFSFFGFKFEIVKRDRNQITLLRIAPPRAGAAPMAKAS